MTKGLDRPKGKAAPDAVEAGNWNTGQADASPDSLGGVQWPRSQLMVLVGLAVCR